MAISPETIEEVYKTANIYDIVSKYITLEKAGSNYKALCPFHTEKTPSFYVSPSKNIFKCFGCGKAGDSIKFLMEYKGITFSEAITEIAQNYGIPIKYIGNKKEDKKLKDLYLVIEKITNFYQEELKKSKQARDYIKKRRLNVSVIEKFRIGYSSGDISKLLEYAKKENITIEQLKEIGVLKEVGINKRIDRFKNRIIFPIRNHLGKVVAFGGRAIDPNQNPKYLNSPETKIYTKSKVLYGLYEARDYIREKKSVLIVEGYFDLLSMYQVGFRNIVATLGTALTIEHGKLLKKFVEKAYLMFDNDEAGQKAVINASKILLTMDIDVYYTPLQDKDPDELAQKGKKEVEQILEQSKDIFETLIEKIKNTENLKERGRFINLYVELSNCIPNKIKTGLLLKELSRETGISERYLETKNAKTIPKYTEEVKIKPKLTKKERIVLKSLINYRDEVLKKFKKFDKIRGSEYFNYLINEIIEDRPLEEDIISYLNSSNEPYEVEIALKILNEMLEKWNKEEEKLNILFKATEEELLKLINQKINNK